MRHVVFGIFDGAASAYLPPFMLPRAEMARRAFADLVNQKGHQFNEHTADYSLYELGNFDDATGVYENALPGPRLICLGASLKNLDISNDPA